MAKLKNSTLAFVMIAGLAIAAGLFVQQSKRANAKLPQLQSAIILPTSRALTGIDLVDHNGLSFTINRLQGYWTIMFFGFTHCPDVCPTTMATLKQVKQRLSEQQKWGNYQVVMVSVDPQRDTPKQLANYVPFFDSEFVGVTGSVESLASFAKQVGVLFVSHETNDPNNYEVDHSASVILINPKGQWAGAFSAPHKVAQMSSDLSLLADFYADDHHPSPATSLRPALNSSERIAAVPQVGGISIREAWIRPAPPTATSMAAYFEIDNNSDSDIKIVEAFSPQFETAMIHNTELVDGVAKMIHLDSLLVPAQGSASLMPMATHLMLVEPQNSLAQGSLVDITLVAENGAEFSAQIEVRTQPE